VVKGASPHNPPLDAEANTRGAGGRKEGETKRREKPQSLSAFRDVADRDIRTQNLENGRE